MSALQRDERDNSRAYHFSAIMRLLLDAGELDNGWDATDAEVVSAVRSLLARAGTTHAQVLRAEHLRTVEAQLNNRLRAVYQFTGRELGELDAELSTG